MSGLIRVIQVVAVLGIILIITGCSPLLTAARNNDIAEVSRLIDSGANVNENFNGETALVYASIGGHTELARLLLDRGAAVDTSIGHGLTPLFYALKRQNPDLARLLIDRGANVAVAASKLKSIGDQGAAGLELLNQMNTSSRSVATTYPYEMIETIPAGAPLPIDGVWTINQGRLRIAGGRMFFINDVTGVAKANMVNIKEIRQTGAKTYSLRGFVVYNGQKSYIPGEFEVLSDRSLKLTLSPSPIYGLANGYTETYTRDVLDNETWFTAQLSHQADTDKNINPPSTPAFLAAPDSDAVAVVIGIQKYQALPMADFAATDANLIRDYLKAMGYQDRNIELLTDERATYSSVRKAIETWLPKRINSRSRVAIYYAGHGAPDPQSGDAYIVPYDGDPNYLPDTGYPLKRLYEKLDGLPAKQIVVFIDACFSGAGGRGVLAQGARSLVRIDKAAPKGNRVAVLASTQGTQISTSSPDKRQGLFTYYLLQAFRDGKRDLKEVYDYLRPRVEDEAKRMNVEQTPSITPEGNALAKSFPMW